MLPGSQRRVACHTRQILEAEGREEGRGKAREIEGRYTCQDEMCILIISFLPSHPVSIRYNSDFRGLEKAKSMKGNLDINLIIA